MVLPLLVMTDDRPVILINTQRLKGIQLINDAKQVICLPGATLDALEQTIGAASA